MHSLPVTRTPWTTPRGSRTVSKTTSSPRVLAIDPGERWVGLAISDDARRVALPLTTIDRRAEADDGLARIRALLQPESAGLVLIGVPLDPEGEEDVQAARFRRYGERLAAALGIAACAVDERYSNPTDQLFDDFQGGRRFPKPRHSPKDHQRRRRERHATAAAGILQRWLDAQHPGLVPPGPAAQIDSLRSKPFETER